MKTALKGTPVTLCMHHRIPLNICGCVPPDGSDLRESVGQETAARWDSEFRRRQEKVNAEQWLDVDDAREGAEARAAAANDHTWRSRDPEHEHQRTLQDLAWKLGRGALWALGAAITALVVYILVVGLRGQTLPWVVS